MISSYSRSQLINYFRLLSEREVEEARDQAAELIKSDECTEDACLKRMGEILQV